MRKRTRARWGGEKWVNEGWWRWLGTRSNLLQRGPNRDMRKQNCVRVCVCVWGHVHEWVCGHLDCSLSSSPQRSPPPTHSSTLFFPHLNTSPCTQCPSPPSHFLTSSPTPHSTNPFIPLPLCPFQGRPRYNPSLWASQHVSHQATVLRAVDTHSAWLSRGQSRLLLIFFALLCTPHVHSCTKIYIHMKILVCFDPACNGIQCIGFLICCRGCKTLWSPSQKKKDLLLQPRSDRSDCWLSFGILF